MLMLSITEAPIKTAKVWRRVGRASADWPVATLISRTPPFRRRIAGRRARAPRKIRIAPCRECRTGVMARLIPGMMTVRARTGLEAAMSGIDLRPFDRPLHAAMAAAALLLGTMAPPARAEEPFTFDVIVPLTGGGAFLGGTEKAVIDQTVNIINHDGGVHGRPVRFVFHDDQSSPQVAVQLTNDAIANHPPVIFGSTISGICNAMSPLMAAAGPVQWCFSPSIRPAPGGYVFTTQVASRDQQRALMTYFQAKGWKRVALVTTTDASGQDAEKAITDLLKEPKFADLNLVENTHFNASDVGITAQIERIRAANPQVVVSWATAAAGATVFRALVQAGLDLPVAASASNMTYGQMIEYAAFLPKQLFFGTSAWAAANDPRIDLAPEVAAEQKRFYAVAHEAGLHIDGVSDAGWDPMRLITTALNKLPPGADAAALHDYLEHVKGYAGIDGVYDFTRVPQRGIDISDTIVVRWDAATKNWMPMSKLSGIPLS
jgi:branched-chain amino acid transport system substrate-binding protein